MRDLQRLVYPSGHPYRKDSIGTEETVKDLERSDVKDYFENVISKATTLIAFAGQFKKDEVVGWAARTFATRSEKKIFFTSRGRHTRFDCDWSSDVCSSD